MPEFYFGIDFGTTNSAVVALRPRLAGEVFHAVTEGEGEPVPSVLAYAADGRVRVGAGVRGEIIALREGGLETVVESVKTVIEENSHAGGRTAVDVTSDLLRYLSRLATRDAAVGCPIEKAVFAIPVGWSGPRRACLRAAAEKAGIHVMGFISEPTAALLAMHQAFRMHDFVAVFDWGGGTLDVSVLRRGLLGWEEVAKRGLSKAGDYIDEQIARVIHSRIVSARGVDAAWEDVEVRTRQILSNRVEELKRRLQRVGAPPEAVALLRYEVVGGPRIDSPKMELSAREVNSIIEPVVAEAIECLEDTVRDAKISRERLGALLVVGGSSQLLLLRERLEADGGWPTQFGPVMSGGRHIDDQTTLPAWLVARGAAILARAGGRCARLSEDIGLLVAESESPFFRVLGRGETAAEHERGRFHSFGLVEDSSTASFIVASRREGGKPARVAELGLPVKGFSSERLSFGLAVDKDDVVHARAASSHLPEAHVSVPLENVRWAYDVESASAGGSR